MLTNDNTESRRLVEQCYKRHKTNVNPIIEWTETEVWEFIKSNGIPYCSLYNEGFARLGCIGCPMAKRHGREREFARWPKYKEAYLKAFERMLKERAKRQNKSIWKQGGQELEQATATDVFNWWMEYDILPGQYNLFDDIEEIYDS